LWPREENFISSVQLVSVPPKEVANYKDFIKWKKQQKHVIEPYKQCMKEIASSGHVFSNVDNCQIVILESDSG
jgi:hypothetical protein